MMQFSSSAAVPQKSLYFPQPRIFAPEAFLNAKGLFGTNLHLRSQNELQQRQYQDVVSSTQQQQMYSSYQNQQSAPLSHMVTQEVSKPPLPANSNLKINSSYCTGYNLPLYYFQASTTATTTTANTYQSNIMTNPSSRSNCSSISNCSTVYNDEYSQYENSIRTAQSSKMIPKRTSEMSLKSILSSKTKHCINSIAKTILPTHNQSHQTPITPESPVTAFGLFRISKESLDAFEAYEDSHESPDADLYGEEIIDYMLEIEVQTQPTDYFKIGFHKFTSRERKNIVLRLIELQTEWNLTPETLYLSVNIMDRFCSKYTDNQIDFEKLVLVGITSLWIAAKYEENHGRVPNLKMLESASGFIDKQLKSTEKIILQWLDYKLGHPTVEAFFKATAKRLQLCPQVRALARYLSEASLVNCHSMLYLSSEIADASIRVACSMYQDPTKRFPTDQCATLLTHCISHPPKYIAAKYERSVFLKASLVAEYFRKSVKQRVEASRQSFIPPTPPKETSQYWNTCTWSDKMSYNTEYCMGRIMEPQSIISMNGMHLANDHLDSQHQYHNRW